MNIISLGAGVQSSTMALMAAHGEIGPMPDCAIFADTGDEPKKVYEWLDWLEKQLPFPVYRVQRGIISEDSLKIYLSKKTNRTYNSVYAAILRYTPKQQQVTKVKKSSTVVFNNYKSVIVEANSILIEF